MSVLILPKRIYRPARPRLVSALAPAETVAPAEWARQAHAALQAQIFRTPVASVPLATGVEGPRFTVVGAVAGVGAGFLDSTPDHPTGGWGGFDLTGDPAFPPALTDLSKYVQQNGRGDCYFEAPIGSLADVTPEYLPRCCVWPDRTADGAIIPDRWVVLFHKQNNIFARIHLQAWGDASEDVILDRVIFMVLMQTAYAFYRLGTNNLPDIDSGVSNAAMWDLGLWTTPAEIPFESYTAPWPGAGWAMPTSAVLKAAIMQAHEMGFHVTYSTVQAPRNGPPGSHCLWGRKLALQTVTDAGWVIGNPWADQYTGGNRNIILPWDTVLGNGYIDIGKLPPLADYPPLPTFAPLPPLPPAVSFAASQGVVTPGTAITLTWDAQHADSVTLDGQPVAVSDSAQRTVFESKTFTLLATGPGGQQQAQAIVNVVTVAPTAESLVGIIGGFAGPVGALEAGMGKLDRA